MATLANPIAVALRDLAVRSLPRVDALRERITGFIGETAIAYRESPAAVDVGGLGSVRAGDRAADADVVRACTTSPLLAPLGSGRHLAIVIDAVTPLEAGPHVDVLALAPAEVDEATIEAYGRGTMHVIRPDGYVG